MNRLFLLLPGILACQTEAKKVTPAAFDRPERLAFVCYATDGTPLPLSECDDIDPEGESEQDDPTVLHGLVTQSARGEVAAVDLQTRTVLDSDPRIPGYTFVAVGEIPSAIVVSPSHPEVAYVADFGTRDILAIPTNRFRAEETQASVVEQRISLPSGPTHMVLAPDGSALYVVLPGWSSLVRIAVDSDGVLGDPEDIVLAATIPDLVEAAEDPDYCKACPAGTCDGLASSSSVAPRAPLSLGTAPRPAALAMDELENRLLIADDQLPLIHQIDLSDVDAPDDPISVGVPVADLAITPRVSAVAGDDTETRRYIYAIDASDRSVLAVDYDTRSVLHVSARPDTRADRIALGTGAEILEVFDTGDRDCTLGNTDEEAEAEPTRLRGVFLGIGLLDGRLAIVDVEDADIACRGGDLACENGPADQEEAVFIRRHRPRVGATLASDFVAISNIDLNLGAAPAQLRLIETCPAPLAALPGPFNDEDFTLCGIVDPWGAIDETWTVEFEGSLPATSGGRGRLSMEDDQPTFSGEIPFCARGVLGSLDLPADGPEAEYEGDLLVLAGNPPASTVDEEVCAFLDVDPGTPRPRLEFPILHAFEEHLILADETRAIVDTDSGARLDPIAFEDVAACFVELSAYEIRPRGAFMVTSSISRVRHRVTADEEGACFVEETQPETDVNRTRGFFNNGQVAFDVVTPDEGSSMRFAFRMGEVPALLRLEVGALPSAILYSPLDHFLYALDSGGGGLLQVDPDTFTVTHAFQ